MVGAVRKALSVWLCTPVHGACERITAIVFEGNDVTRDEVLAREVSVHVGDACDAQAVERSRVEIQNLGLFRSVEAITEPVEDGVRVIFRVREKWYWQACPRVSANSDGQNSIGPEARVSNLWGLNHTLAATPGQKIADETSGYAQTTLRRSCSASATVWASMWRTT